MVIRFDGDIPIYDYCDVKGRIARRDSKVFVSFATPKGPGEPPEIVWEPGPERPARDSAGCYWVETEGRQSRRYLFHESGLQRDTSPVFIRVDGVAV